MIHHTFPRSTVLFWVKVAFVLVVCTYAQSALSASMAISPSTGVYTAGQTFTARVVVNTSGESINAADGRLSFDTSQLSVVGVSKGSVFSLWTEDPSYSNSAGTISFSGGTPNGYSGSAGTLLTITFRAKSAGSPKVTFSSGSVLAADGRGTNVLTSMGSGSYTITAAEVVPEPETIEYVAPANTPSAPVVSSPTHSDPSLWYQNNTAELSWTLPSGITGVRTLLDRNSGTIPTKVYDSPIDRITLEDLEEGVQYFHIQFRNENGWGRVTHYRLAVDTQDPTSFDISLPENADLSNPEQMLVLTTKDETSSVLRFMVQIDGSEPYEFIDSTASGTITLPPLEPGHHTVIIEAFDQAGNSIADSLSFSILAFDRPQFTEYPSQINDEVIPVIKGITRPHAEVRITMQKLGADAQEYAVTATGDGLFTFIPEGTLSLGVYELSAVAIDQNGAQSDVSETIRIAVQQPGYLRIGSMAVSILSVIIPLLALCGLLIAGLWFFFIRLGRLRRGVSRESGEAMKMLTSEFDELEALIKKQRATLASSRKTKKLTKAEESMLDTLQRELADARTRVAKEIGDVTDIVE